MKEKNIIVLERDIWKLKKINNILFAIHMQEKLNVCWTYQVFWIYCIEENPTKFSLGKFELVGRLEKERKL